MFVISKVDFFDSPKNLDVVVDGYLEAPAASNLPIAVDNNNITIKGWVLFKQDAPATKLCARNECLHLEADFTASRSDVLEAHPTESVKSECGFTINIPLIPAISGIEVCLMLGDTIWPWARIYFDASESHSVMSAYWKGICKNNWGALTPEILSTTPAETLDAYKDFLGSALVTLNHMRDLPSLTYLSEEKKAWLNNACTHFSAADIVEKMTREALSQQHLSYNDVTSKTYFCDASFAMGEFNFLYYRSANDCFFVIQYCYSSIGIYVPELAVSISLAHWHGILPKWVNALNEYLLKNAAAVFDYLHASKRTFGGFILGNSRPYHFFYDQVTTYYHLSKMQISDFEKTTVYFLSNHSFLSEIEFSDSHVSRFIDDTDEINLINREKASFCLMIGAWNSRFNGRDVTEKCFESLLCNIKKPTDSISPIQERLEKLSHHYPVFWFGVAGQKREWVEQVDGLKNIIHELYKRFPHMAVIFDGWTFPLVAQKSDSTEATKDRALMERIVDSIPKDIYVESVIGETSAEKLLFAERVDAYITNWLQGSLHVDNICKKMGVGHFNKMWHGYDSFYYHQHCLKIDDEFITHMNDGGIDEISYSIPWERVYERLCELMETLPAFTNPPLSASKETVLNNKELL